MLSTQMVRDRLAGTERPTDPRRINLPLDGSPWQAVIARYDSAEMKPAAVLIPVLERDSGSTVLLTQRSKALKHHAGQVSFPGGRMEQSDVDVVATALRETHEEIGIAPPLVDVVGFLPTMPTITGYVVSPVVGYVDSDAAIAVDPGEVDYAFEVPLDFLLDKASEKRVDREVDGQMLSMVEYHWQSERIWGATAYMIRELRKLLLDK